MAGGYPVGIPLETHRTLSLKHYKPLTLKPKIAPKPIINRSTQQRNCIARGDAEVVEAPRGTLNLQGIAYD